MCIYYLSCKSFNCDICTQIILVCIPALPDSALLNIAYNRRILLSGPIASGLIGSVSSNDGWYHCKVISLSVGVVTGLSSGLRGSLKAPGGGGGIPGNTQTQLIWNCPLKCQEKCQLPAFWGLIKRGSYIRV